MEEHIIEDIFNEVEEKYKWFAIDSNGYGRWYSGDYIILCLESGTWDNGDEDFSCMLFVGVQDDWTKSLKRRQNNNFIKKGELL